MNLPALPTLRMRPCRAGWSTVRLGIGVLLAASLHAATYHVDSARGDDANAGTAAAPFKTTAKVESLPLQPGDRVSFARGTSYPDTFRVQASGTASQPILVTAHGTGPRPAFVGARPDRTHAIVLEGDYIVLEEVFAADAIKFGVRIVGTHATVRECEITRCGAGVDVMGSHATVTRCHLHAMRMIRDTPGGDDDFGANGIIIEADHGEYSHNTITDCIAPSHDYGVDGGAFEIYGHVANVAIHHNDCQRNDGLFEAGGGSASHLRIAYNLCIDNHTLGGLHLGGKFGGRIVDFRIENNTVVERTVKRHDYLFWLNGRPTPPQAPEVSLVNNVFVFDNVAQFTNVPEVAHHHNLFFSPSQLPLGLALGPGERVADPQFVAADRGDFRLRPGSPAIGAGVDLGLATDFAGRLVPTPPSLGALEPETR